MISGAGGGGGKGGGGGSSRVPVESPDSLRSRQYARVLDALCEGPIVGLVNGLQSVFLNDVPLQNADASYNFSGVNVATTLGTQIQNYLPGYGDPQATTAVGVEIKAATPVVQTIAAGANLDAVQVTIGFPALSYQNPSNGDLGGTSVDIAIDLQINGGGYAQVIADTITGKTITRYQRSYRIALTGTGPWDIRVRRITPDSTASNLQNKTWWDLYVGLVDSKLRYPNTALIGIQVDASQFNAIPKRSYDVKMLQVSIPSNYNPTTRVYTGVWDGTFTTAWTDNPAWCFYDLLTNSRYGLGEFVNAAQVDKWGLYTIAQYCDQMVPDGFGGTEPRFTCNLYLQTRQDAYTVLMNFASLFRAITYWGSGSIYTVQDAPASPIAHFTNANVIDGEFSYSGSSRRGRHTVVLVSWNDPADYYRQKIEYVSDDAGIARYGVQQSEIVAMGCTSRGQAHRLGKWMLLSETLELEVINFKAGLDGTSLHPGAIIRTLDRHRAGVRYGGRVVAATTTSLTIDDPVTISSGISYNVTVTLPDGSLVTSTLTNAPGATSVLTWTAALTSVPQVNSVWVLAADNVNPEVWRVISLVEKDMSQVEITALAHDVNKYANSENSIQLQPLPTTTISISQGPVSNISITESLYIKADSITNRMTIAWDAATGATRYRVEYKKDQGNWVSLPDVAKLSVDVDADPGAYTARVIAVNVVGTTSATVTYGPVTLLGKTAPPPDVDMFLVTRQPDGTRQFTWDLYIPPLDLAGYKIRYKLGSGSTWGTMTDMHSGLLLASPFETNQLAAGTYDFAIKSVDTSGNESVNAKFINLTIGDPRLAGVLAVYEENGIWSGTLTACHLEPLTGYLQPNETAASPWLTTWSGKQWIITPAGTIQYEKKFDVGIVTAFTPLITVGAIGSVTIQEAHSNDDITYTAFAAAGTQITARYVKIHVAVTGTWPILQHMATILSATPISEDINDLSTSGLTGGYRIGVGNVRLPITKTYVLIKSVNITLQNVGAGWSWELIDKNVSPGPQIKIYNASNALADAIVDATVRGL